MRRAQSGFTLTELAVVMAIVALLLTATMYTLSAQTEQRNRNDTERRLQDAKDLLLSFALINGRLPCPGVATGDESGGGAAACTSNYGGFLPGRAIGYQPVDANGFALDAWNSRIRYAVSQTTWGVWPARFTRQHGANASTVATIVPVTAPWSLTQTPADLVVCNASPAAPAATACDAGTAVTNQNVVVAVVFSTGKNGATGGTGTNEARNLDANSLFVSRPPDPAGAAGGEFDDHLVWIPVGVLYGRLISAGVLP
jgi:prepilin-type N-terminal cleavage/methylation domain-containing protein